MSTLSARVQTFQSALTATLSFITFCFETNGIHPVVVENVNASPEFCCARVSTPLLLGRLRVVGSCEKSFEPQPVFTGNVGKLYSIANLEVARHDYASCAHLYIINPEHNFQLSSHFQCEHHLYVKTVQAEISGFDAERRCGPLRL